MEGLLQEGEEEWRARMAKGKSDGSSDGIWKRYWIVEIGKGDRGMKRVVDTRRKGRTVMQGLMNGYCLKGGVDGWIGRKRYRRMENEGKANG